MQRLIKQTIMGTTSVNNGNDKTNRVITVPSERRKKVESEKETGKICASSAVEGLQNISGQKRALSAHKRTTGLTRTTYKNR